jgi:RNA polymerase sigma-70 factor (ECF subfamily)
MSIEEKILFREILRGNKEVFESLFREYFGPLSRYAERYVYEREAAEDIVQNLFVYLWENAEQIHIQTSLKSYLYQSVKNRCMNYLRDLNIHDRHNLLYMESVMEEKNEENVIDQDLVEKIKIAIDQLPGQIASIFKLKYLQGKKQKEIAEELNISENTVKTQILRGKDKLRKQFMNLINLNFLF